MRRTLKQLASELSVSPMTVSRALRGVGGVSAETAARIREHAQRVNYRPNLAARSLAAKRVGVLGIIVPNLRHSFWLEMVMGAEQVARKSGYQVFLSHSADDPELEREEIWALVGRRVDAVLLASCDPDRNADVINEVRDEWVPVILFDRHGETIRSPGVYADDVGGARRATEHLLGLGYQRVAHLAGDMRFSPARARVRGYEDAMKDHGAEPLVWEAGFGEDNGYRGMASLMETHHVDAVFVSHDPSAIGALRAALDRGKRVPEDIAIVGFGNTECSAHVAVPLTTVCQPTLELGEVLGDLALRTLSGSADGTETIVLPTGFVVRRSCGASLRRQDV